MFVCCASYCKQLIIKSVSVTRISRYKNGVGGIDAFITQFRVQGSLTKFHPRLAYGRPKPKKRSRFAQEISGFSASMGLLLEVVCFLHSLSTQRRWKE